MSHGEHQYLDLLRDVLENGVVRDDRTGTGTLGVFGRQIRFDLGQGFPLLTTKKVHFKAIAVELLWFLRGETNVKFLHDHGVTIWDEWIDENGDLGPVYGKQWRSWPGNPMPASFPNDAGGETPAVVSYPIDQIAKLIDGLKGNPYGRRHIVTAWNPAEIDDMALPPCHCLFQFFVADGKLSCQLYQRSADLFLGVPFNIASYALLTHMVARIVGLEVGEFVHTFGDAHIYLNHLDQVREQLTREPRPWPTIHLHERVKGIDEFNLDDIALGGYDPHPAIRAEVSK